jgi:transposase
MIDDALPPRAATADRASRPQTRPAVPIRKLLLTACEDLDTRGWWRLAEGLRAGDPDHELLAAWQLKEIARDAYRTRDEDQAREALDLLYAWAETTATTECYRFAGTVRRWEA